MPEFLVTTINERGHRLEQTEHGETEAEVRERVRQQGLLVQTVRRQQGMPGFWKGRTQSVPQDQFLIFNQQFVTLIRAGLPILRALELLEKRSRHPRLMQTIASVRARVKGGDLLSDAFRKESGIPEIYTTTLLAGERSGNMDEVLTRYVQYQRLALSVRRKLISSLIYPAVLMGLVVTVLTFLVTYVVPRFGELYKSLDAQLPPLTIFMLNVGQTIRHDFPWMVGGLIAAILGLRAWSRQPAVKRRMDRVVLNFPLLGELWWKYQVALLARTLGTLMTGGIPLVQALDTASSALHSFNLRQGLHATMREVREGKPLAEGLGRNRVLPALAVEMVEVGESTGALPQMLTSVAEFYDEDLSNALTAILSLIEPAILVVVGTVVALVLISLYLPIFSLGSQIKG